MRTVRWVLLALCAAAFLAAGCGKKPEPVTPAPAKPSTPVVKLDGAKEPAGEPAKKAESQAESAAKADKAAADDKANGDKAKDKPPADAKGEGKLVTTKTGLQYTDEKVGTGKSPRMGDQVTVNYRGTLKSNGKEFDSSYKRGEPAQFRIGQVIEGWNEGLQTMKEGGKRKLVIPAKLAYGANPPPGSGIGPNADLVFEVELLKVN